MLCYVSKCYFSLSRDILRLPVNIKLQVAIVVVISGVWRCNKKRESQDIKSTASKKLLLLDDHNIMQIRSDYFDVECEIQKNRGFLLGSLGLA